MYYELLSANTTFSCDSIDKHLRRININQMYTDLRYSSLVLCLN